MVEQPTFPATYRVGFLMSQNLGHVVHDARLHVEVAKHPDMAPHWMPIYPWAQDGWQKLPLVKGNLTLLSGLRARDQLRSQVGKFDALYCHTQEAATLLGDYMKRIPTILSLDATPINMDSIGHAYSHGTRSEIIEKLKHWLTKRSFHRAAHLVAFSEWARNSLLEDYGVSEDKVTVNSPGVDLNIWKPKRPKSTRETTSPLRILFVGGDFQRKGGELLVRAAGSMPETLDVDIVTNAEGAGAGALPNVSIHRGLNAGSSGLLELFAKADVFVLPTLGDCSPWVILEAMAMRLPVISTSVGGIPEVVIHGTTGLLIPPNSVEALIDAMKLLNGSPDLCRAMGDAGRARVEQHFDGERSYQELIALIRKVAANNRQ